MAWICEDCGAEFDEPGTIKEKHEFWGAPCYETFLCCPKCKSDYIEEIKESEVEEDELG